MRKLIDIIEDVLGKGQKVGECTPKQIEALVVILDNLQSKKEELGI